ncbi:unnamed protein product [Mycena citricolor]|uniref:Uncharacterized protein n=1 Tax=Mycena citricolor TaxID=2018698 RepID=A0AAD2Q457_9AGAR|nr:unnamed protein product [Mycena citricolor]
MELGSQHQCAADQTSALALPLPCLMDDTNPWGTNAWASSSEKLPVAPSASLQARPQALDDEQQDITIPAWEPPASDAAPWATHTSNALWGAPSPALDKFPSWSSPYDDLLSTKTTNSTSTTTSALTTPFEPAELRPQTPELEQGVEDLGRNDNEALDAQSELETVVHIEPASPTLTLPQDRTESSTSSHFQRSPPGSPDPFGTFETGLDEQVNTSTDAWSPSHNSFETEAEGLEWGGGWGAVAVDEEEKSGSHDGSETVDEWELAKQQKAKQDRHVPPELLASILAQLNDLENEIHPPLSNGTIDPEDWRNNRFKGLQDVDTSTPTIIRLLATDLILPAPRPFSKSTLAKHASDALRMSRNAPFVRRSPLSYYSATKGSTAWETSVKNRPEVVGEPDLLPLGWRIVETQSKEETSTADKKKTGHGGLLSFFGRRDTLTTGEGTKSRSASPTASPRASTDSSSLKSPTSISSMTSASAASVTSPTSVASATPTASVTPSPIPPISPPQPPPIVAASVSEPAPSTSAIEQAAPSRMSRFLGRFGRKSDTGPQRIALSDNDFDFLADIEAAPLGSSLAPDHGFSMSSALLDDPVPVAPKLAPPPRLSALSPPPSTVPASLAQPPSAATQTIISPPVISAPVFAAPVFAAPVATTPAVTTPAVTTPVFAAPVVAPSIVPPPLASSFSAPMEADFSAWGFDDETPSPITRVESEPTSQRRQLNTRATSTIKGIPPRRAPVAIMSSGPSRPSAAVPKLGALNIPPPPRAQTSTPSLAANLVEDDDFSDFHASAPLQPSSAAHSLYDTSFSSSTSSSVGLFGSGSSAQSGLFDDFDDFIEAGSPATLRTPSPPRPPVKPIRAAKLPPPPLSLGNTRAVRQLPPDSPDDTPLAIVAQQAQRAANHQRTLSLVENAAASSGVRWPAPASPLPDVIAPPPNATDPFGFADDLGATSTMQSQQAAFLSSVPTTLPSSVSATFPLRTGTPLQRSLSPPVPPKLTPLPFSMSSTGPTNSSSGLSAQDLSFFEGL